MNKEILIIVITAVTFLYSCGKTKRGIKGEKGNKTVVYEVEGQQGPKGEAGVGEKGTDGKNGESCKVVQEADGATIFCENSIAKVQAGVGCYAIETSAGIEVTCANGTTFIKHGSNGAIGPTGAAGIPGVPGRDGQTIVIPQPRYSKTCYRAIDSADECGNIERYHIFYRVNTMPNGDVVSQICEGYNVNQTNCTSGRLTQATLVIGDSRYPQAPVASQYTAAKLIDPLVAEINFRGNKVNVSCQGN